MKANIFRFSEKDITVYCGTNARFNSEQSLLQAGALASVKRHGKILYINTFLTKRKILASARPVLGENAGSPQSNVRIYTSRLGYLGRSLREIEEIIRTEKITCVIINSWEYAHSSYSTKENTFFHLIGMAHDLGISLIIYTQAKNAIAGEIHRGGLGKLSGIAAEIVTIEPEDREEEESEKEEIEKLSISKIKELGYAQHDLGRDENKVIVKERQMEELSINL